MSELLLKNGFIVDGTGRPRERADLLVRDDRIAALLRCGENNSAPASLDCTGLIIAPGFVDVHTHSDYDVIRHLPGKLIQGVTTEIVGNCGYSLFPRASESERVPIGEIFVELPEMPMQWASDYFLAVGRAQPLVNVASLVGHSSLRGFVMGAGRRAPANHEMQGMESLLDASLADGAMGLSTGLNCLPGSFADFGELAALCRVLKSRGGFYTTHMRDYKFRILEAVEESLGLAESADIPIQLSHLQVVGKKNWHRLDSVLELVEGAARRGVDVAMDAYPYLAGSCSFVQFLPEWCQDGGLKGILDRLASASMRAEIAAETDSLMSNTWADLIVSDVMRAESRPLIGQSFQEIADARGLPAPALAMELLFGEEGRVFVISFNSTDENLKKVLLHPMCSVCSDNFTTKGLHHPRAFGTYPTLFGEYVREKGWMTIEEGVRKASALPAERFHLSSRGSIRPGNFADLVVFDPLRIGSAADYAHPEEAPQGVLHVLVNGRPAVLNGELTGNRAGSIVSRQ